MRIYPDVSRNPYKLLPHMSSSVADGADGNAALHFYIHIDICKHMELLREAVFMNIYAVFRLNVSCLTLERLAVGARQQNP